ncbi:hypothetical protein IEN85_15110 [Pelagicoccus sp. NFK12]|uniref:Novel STAND NTPase 1 domain-containing protein n=1 Tax=Pelagicoccus enzymogenes TaxID=2773457 RepID=A0A927FCC6_9BACT|nr:hypothetical protein [Pelagicoccus enzymogenes]MBD5780828.1 hypothetical protein [Pelagicoccus enzymogenes]
MPTKPTITQIENAFSPAKEIDDPQRFAGRKKFVEDSYYALISEGTNIAVIGNRGIGKTSLARQIINIATGRNELLKKIKIETDQDLDFLSIYYTCGKTTETHEHLLESLLTNRTCLLDWIYDIPKARRAADKFKPKLNVGAFSLEGEKGSETTYESSVSNHGVETVFTNVVSAITEQGMTKDGVLFVIDEFDQIKNKQGFATFLKALATNVPNVKFCIVGVAHDVQELIEEHESSDRLFAGGIIDLPSMSDAELEQIISDAEQSIDSYIRFDPNAKKELVRLSQGHPYMTHLIGKYVLRNAYRESGRDIGGPDIAKTLRAIAESGIDPILESRYKKAVASSRQREIVLRALSDVQKDSVEIHTADAYKRALDEGVDNPSQFVGHLVTEDYGAEIVKTRERYYRFRDSLFAAYVSARPRVFKKENLG